MKICKCDSIVIHEEKDKPYCYKCGGRLVENKLINLYFEMNNTTRKTIGKVFSDGSKRLQKERNEATDMIGKLYGMLQTSQETNKKLIEVCDEYDKLCFKAICELPSEFESVKTLRREYIVANSKKSKIVEGDKYYEDRK